MELTIRQMIGQKTILGFHGPDLPEDFEAFIREYQVGNVILFQRNVQSADQLYTLCQKIRRVILEATGFPPFIVIDQEGGLESRIPPDAVNVPSAMALGATGNPENAFEAAKITARQLRGLGLLLRHGLLEKILRLFRGNRHTGQKAEHHRHSQQRR